MGQCGAGALARHARVGTGILARPSRAQLGSLQSLKHIVILSAAKDLLLARTIANYASFW
jgi:hypothetical protein